MEVECVLKIGKDGGGGFGTLSFVLCEVVNVPPLLLAALPGPRAVCLRPNRLIPRAPLHRRH